MDTCAVKRKIGRSISLLMILLFGIVSTIGSGGGGGDDGVTTYSVGGAVDGLTGTGLVLQNNGGNDLSINADGAFTFTTKLANAATYNVTVATQPSGQTCSVINGSGTISSANVTSVFVNCIPLGTFSVGGNVSGLTGAGLVLQNNGGDNLSISTNTAFVFATPLADSANYNVTVLTQPAGQACSVTYGSGTIASANITNVVVSCVDFSNTSGIWRGTQTYTAASGTSCDNAVNDVETSYISVIQTDGDLTAINVEGITLTGTIGITMPATVVMSGTKSLTDVETGDTIGVSVDFDGTLNAVDSMTGTLTINTTVNSTTVCVASADYNGNHVYTHTGTENYDGLYTLELESDTSREIGVMEIDITGSTVAVYNNLGAVNLASSSYNADTGYFTLTIEDTENIGGGTSVMTTEIISGLTVRADTDTSGLPIIALQTLAYLELYDGPDGTGTVTAAAYLGLAEGYGKRQTPQAFMRSNYYRLSGGGYVEGINVGLQHPPLKTSNGLYVEVLDGTTRLCTGTYANRYHQTQYLPPANLSSEAFQANTYSFVYCNTSDSAGVHSVLEGNTYTIRAMDTGADGVVDGGDDTEVFSATIVAAVAGNFFSEFQRANSFTLNNHIPPATMRRGVADGVIDFFGFVDVTEDLDFSWATIAGADDYQVRMRLLDDITDEVRINVAGTSTTIPAKTLDEDDPSTIRIVARKTDVNNGAIAYSLSTFLNVTPGVRGVFNVELDEVLDPPYWAFQVELVADMQGNVSKCQVTNNSMWQCVSGSVDYTTNQVSLEMDDGGAYCGGGNCTMIMTFTDSANGTVYSPDITGLGESDGAATHVRLVNPELQIRSVHRTGDPSYTQQTQVTIHNAIDAGTGGIFEQAIFKADDDSNLIVGTVDTGSTTETIWNNTVGGLEWINNVGTFIVLPTDDGVAQDNGASISKLTQFDWSLGLGLLDPELYKAVINTVDPGLKWIFKLDYTQPDPTGLVAPLLTDITVDVGGSNIAAGTGVGDTIGTAINISTDPNFDLTWTGETVTDGEWQLIFRDTDLASDFQLRTEWMNAATHPDLTDNGNGTFTWVNNGPAVPTGMTLRINIRTRDAADTMYGIQRGLDSVYVTNP